MMDLYELYQLGLKMQLGLNPNEEIKAEHFIENKMSSELSESVKTLTLPIDLNKYL